MPKLTKMFISNIQPPEKGQVIYRDSILQGLGLRVTPKSISYIVEGRNNGSFRRISLGKEWQLTPTNARKKAMKVLTTMASGKDPTLEFLAPGTQSKKCTVAPKSAWESCVTFI